MPVTQLEPIFVDQSTGKNNISGGTSGSTPVQVFAKSATDLQHTVRSYSKQIGQTRSLFFPQEKIKYYVQIDYSKYSRRSGDATWKVRFQRTGSVYLPLPMTGMTDTHDIDYMESELGITGAGTNIAQDVINGIQKSLDAALSAGQQGIAEFAASIGTNLGVVSSITGLAPNKFLTVLLKGPRYKRHEWVWKLYPSNYRESVTIGQILNVFNNAMAPGLSAKELIFDFPYVFYPQFRPNAKFLYKFKPCVLESLSTNYVPPGIPSFYGDQLTAKGTGDNPPECVEIRARFLEVEFWLRNQFNFTNDTNINARHRNIDIAKNAIAKNVLEGFQSADLILTPEQYEQFRNDPVGAP